MMEMDKALRIGIIGAGPGGWGAVAHIPAIRAQQGLALTALCTSRAETAQAAGQAHGVSAVYWQPEALCADQAVDLVSVCVRVEDHAALVQTALAAGKNVYCEWPLASNSADAERLAELARAAGKVAAIGLQARYSPDLNWLKDLLASGLIGAPLSSSLSLSMPWTTKFRYNQKRASGGNFLPILGGHALEGMCYLLGEVESLVATAAVMVPEVDVAGEGPVARDAPEHVAVSGRLEGGTFFTFALHGGGSRGTGLRWEIHGRNGDLVLTPKAGTGSVQRAEFDVLHINADGVEENLTLPKQYLAGAAAAPQGAAFNVGQSYHAVLQAVQGKAPLKTDFDHALRRHWLIDAIYGAAETGARFRRQADGRYRQDVVKA